MTQISHEITIWLNLAQSHYQDEILYDSSNYMILKYYGQKKKRCKDKYIRKDAYVFVKQNSKYKFIGIVDNVKPMSGISNCYEIVVDRHDMMYNNELFANKEHACRALNIQIPNNNIYWYREGIIIH